MNIEECPICGSPEVHIEIGDFVCHDGFRIPNITFVKCDTCGEKFYDKSASQLIDQTLIKAGRLARPEYLQAV